MPVLIHVNKGQIVNLDLVSQGLRVTTTDGEITVLHMAGGGPIRLAGDIGNEVWAMLLGSCALVGPTARPEREAFELALASRIIPAPAAAIIAPTTGKKKDR